jgi:hypothetical protein
MWWVVRVLVVLVAGRGCWPVMVVLVVMALMGCCPVRRAPLVVLGVTRLVMGVVVMAVRAVRALRVLLVLMGPRWLVMVVPVGPVAMVGPGVRAVTGRVPGLGALVVLVVRRVRVVSGVRVLTLRG